MFRHEYFSEFCRSVGHPVRLAILDAIVAHNNCIEESILQVPSVTPTAFAFHIKALKRVGLIKGTIFKSKQCYYVNWDKLETFKVIFDDFYDRVESYRSQVVTNEGKCVKA